MNNTLEKSFTFRAFKFALAFYLIIMTLAMAIMMYRLVRWGYFVLLQTGSELPSTKGKMQAKWEDAQKRMESQNPVEWKIAILEVSGMLNEILGVVGYEGKLLGEKLDSMLPSQLENLEQVKQANKVKNRIVNDESFTVSHEEARMTMETFADALKFLEAIQ